MAIHIPVLAPWCVVFRERGKLQIGRHICQDPGRALEYEWLETNGLGGYATSTILGAHTRRYHSLLTAATRPPTGRTVLFHQLDEAVTTPSGIFSLATHLYHPDVIHPHGHRWLAEFRIDPFPRWVFELPDATVTKTLFLPHGNNVVVVTYEITGTPRSACTLLIRLFVNCRDHHHTTSANPGFRGNVEIQGDRRVLSMSPYSGAPGIWIAHNGRFVADGIWYFNFRYPADEQRGFHDRDDAFSPGTITGPLTSDEPFYILAWTQPFGLDSIQDVKSTANSLETRERTRRRNLVSRWHAARPIVRQLFFNSSQFVVESPQSSNIRSSVMAGFPWFTDWGRDTLISLPGLTLVPGHFEIARDILTTFVGHTSEGMVPNLFPEGPSQPEYNTVDATLWLFHALYRYLCYTHDWAFAKDVYEQIREIVRYHVDGTRYGIRVDDDGLLQWDADGVQLTWMDAKVGDWVVTPRRGKPVEVAALWFNALNVMARLAEEFGDQKTESYAKSLATQCKEGFNQFWNPQEECFFDVLSKDGPDPSIRPNQVFAASLPFPIANEYESMSMMTVVERDLLTPYGLRTLAPQDPKYRGRYEGGPLERDGAYHQGTVWPWLMGPFISALVNGRGGSSSARKRARQLLDTLLIHLGEAGLGGISEIFDGDAPHCPRGCPWQAWSAAEILRALVEDVRGNEPKPP